MMDGAIALPTWTPDRDAKLVELAALGLKPAQIAHRLGGVTELAVIGRCTRRNIELGKAPPTKREQRAQAKRAREASDPMFGIAAPPREDAWTPLPNTEPVKLAELRDSQCAWPICEGGDWKAEAYAHCGEVKPEGLPYCPQHTALAYQGGNHRRARGLVAAFIHANERRY